MSAKELLPFILFVSIVLLIIAAGLAAYLLSPERRGRRLLLPIVIGTFFAAWTVIWLYFPRYAPAAMGLAYPIMPGLILSVATVGGHAFDPWVAAAGNFCVYFVAACIVALAWKWRRTRAGKMH